MQSTSGPVRRSTELALILRDTIKELAQAGWNTERITNYLGCSQHTVENATRGIIRQFKQQRNECIRQEHAAGATPRQLAHRYELDLSVIYRILK